MKLIHVAILLLLFTVFTNAQGANIDLAYSWLLQQPVSDVPTAALTTLAVSKVDASRVTPYTDFIRSQMHVTETCWPKDNCKVQDTALAVIAESKVGLGFTDRTSAELFEDVEQWFIKRQSLAGLNGIWSLQIISSQEGSCSLKYQKQGEGESQAFDLIVKKGKITYGSCKDQTFFNLNSCLGNNLVDKPSTKVEVRCDVGLPEGYISLVYIEGDTIYLVSEPVKARATVWINNGFFGNYLDTLYANWALKTMNSKVNSLIWLKKNAEDNIVGNALLYLATSDISYIGNLLLLRTNFGNFKDVNGEREFDNGFGALAVQTSGQNTEVLDGVREWLGTKQKKADGSWGSDAKTTAMVLYGAFEGGALPEASLCSNGGIDAGEECDGTNLNGETCISLGFDSGTLKCFASGTQNQCKFDDGGCIGGQPCGNGKLETGEQCDDDNINSNDGCSASCFIEQGWNCTDEPSTCAPKCGDGLKRGSESCDDKNTNPGDGCSASCQQETGWTCSGEPSSCTQNPLPCSLNNPQWLNKEGIPISQAVGNEPGRKKGDTVILSISGDLHCKDKSIVFDLFEDELLNDQPKGSSQPVLFNLNDGIAFAHLDPIWEDDNPLPLVEDNPEYYFKSRVIGEDTTSVESSRLVVIRPPEKGTKQCNDDVDNDGDAKIDYPGDPGCVNTTDNTEVDVCASNWKCSIWTPGCNDNVEIQTRGCIDQNECGSLCSGNESCITQRSCSECIQIWQCGDWSDCFDGTQTRTCADRNICGIPCEEGDEECTTERECLLPVDENKTTIQDDDGSGDSDDSDTDETSAGKVCVINNICETEFGENSDNCLQDCPAGGADGGLPDVSPPSAGGDDTGENTFGDFEGEQPSSGRVWIIIIFVLLLLVLIGAYFFIIKKPGSKKKGRPLGFTFPEAPPRKPLFGPQQQLQQPPLPRKTRQEKSKVEDELERSLKEARRLLGK